MLTTTRPMVGILPIHASRRRMVDRNQLCTGDRWTERMEPKGRLMSAEDLMVSRCECGLMMVAMDEKDSGVNCVVEREVDVLYAG